MPIAAVIQLLQIILPFLVKEAPEVIAALRDLFNKTDPTTEDWAALSRYAPDYESFHIQPPPKP
jgi:hypothetical protein